MHHVLLALSVAKSAVEKSNETSCLVLVMRSVLSAAMMRGKSQIYNFDLLHGIVAILGINYHQPGKYV